MIECGKNSRHVGQRSVVDESNDSEFPLYARAGGRASYIGCRTEGFLVTDVTIRGRPFVNERPPSLPRITRCYNGTGNPVAKKVSERYSPNEFVLSEASTIPTF
jgi:hypothetical protein